VSASLRLFASPRDADDDRRAATRQRALQQPRCRCCGRFAKPALFQFGEVCSRCIYDDARPAIQRKVEQARKWWSMTRSIHTA
jgi:NAD-dependent SIR2 family protein deacetylase